jgi:multidrug efflux system membrane fusion protein
MMSTLPVIATATRTRTKPGVVPRVLTLALLPLLALALAGCGSRAESKGAMPPPAQVSAAPVLAKHVAQWDEFSGRFSAVESVELRPRVSGYIEKVSFAEGQEVKKGDVLFELDSRTLRAELARAEAEAARVRSRAALSRSELARAQKLATSHAISAEELDQRQAAAAQAESDVHAAEAAIAVARLNVGFTQVRAPIGGRAGRALVTVGNLAQADTTVLTTLVSLDPVFVYFEGDEQTYLRYNQMARDGKRPSSRDARNPVRVGLSTEDGFPHEGYVDFVDNQVDAATGTIRARAVLANAERMFTPGLFARVQLLGSGSFDALLIDDKAILTDQDRKFVYVVGPDNTAQRRDIVPGRMVDGLRIVSSGLTGGEHVIVHGVQKIFFPGMPVKAQPIAMGDPPPGAPRSVAAAADGAH